MSFIVREILWKCLILNMYNLLSVPILFLAFWQSRASLPLWAREEETDGREYCCIQWLVIFLFFPLIRVPFPLLFLILLLLNLLVGVRRVTRIIMFRALTFLSSFTKSLGRNFRLYSVSLLHGHFAVIIFINFILCWLIF